MGVTQIGTTWETKKKALWLLITDLVCARLVSLETMLLVPSSHLSLVAQDTWESWSVWDKRIPTSVTKLNPREVSRPSNTLSSTVSLPTGTTWRRSGITPSTMSSVLLQKSTLFFRLRLLSTQRLTEKR